MKKSLIRTLYAVFCIAFMFTFMEGVALADESGEWGNLTWKLDSKGTLTISGTGEMEEPSGSAYDYYPWLKNSKSIRKVVIEHGVTSVGANAFDVCTSLIFVSIPVSVTSIGSEAFLFCYSLQSVTMADSVTSIGETAFGFCDKLKSVKLSKNLTSIPAELFFDCESLQFVEIPESVISIGSYAFGGCKALQTVEIPASVTSIEEEAFFYCPCLETVVIQNGVKCLKGDAFAGCGFTSIYIPESVTAIEGNPFDQCNKLVSIEIAPDHLYLELIDNALFTKTDKRLICYTSGLRTKEYIVPDGTTGIESCAFYGQDELESIVIPASVTSIGGAAFSKCDKLIATVIKGSYAQQYCKENGIKTKEIGVSKVNLDPAELFFYVGTDDSQTVKASLEPASVPPIGLTWTPAKKDIVEITETEDGVVSIKPLKAGKTDITVKEPGGKSAKLKVNVVDPVESVELAVKGNAKAGGKVNITATLAPKTAGNKTVEYSLDVGEDIATINNKGQLSISKNALSGTKITVTCTALGAPVPVTASVVVEVP